MFNFVNSGLDERILKSLNAETPDEDLCKAMNKQGMVQREVQVRGKHGTYTRKQWVRASDVQSSQTSKGTSQSDEFRGSGDVSQFLKDSGFSYVKAGHGDPNDHWESKDFVVYPVSKGKYEIIGDDDEPKVVTSKKLKAIVSGKSNKNLVKTQKKESYKDDEFGDYTAADQKAAHEKAQEIYNEFGEGRKLKKLGNFAYAFVSDYDTAKKVMKKYGLDNNYDEYSDGAGFDYSKEVELSGRDGQIFCNQGGFQEDDHVYIGVSFNDL